MDLESGGALLRKHRLEQEITQEELASKARVSRMSVTRLENGTYGKDLPLIPFLRIVRALDLDLQETINVFKLYE